MAETSDRTSGPVAQWRVEVDADRCMATGGCVHALPHIFELGADDVVHVIGPVDGDDPLVRETVDECPTAALRLVASEDPGSWKR